MKKIIYVAILSISSLYAGQEGPEQTIQLSTHNKFSAQFWEELEPYIDNYRALQAQWVKMRITRQEGTYQMQERVLARKIEQLKQKLKNIIGDPNARQYGTYGCHLLDEVFYLKVEMQEKVVRLLLECGADSNVDMRFGIPLFYAKTVPIAELLIRYGADIKKHSRYTAWHTLLSQSMGSGYPSALVNFYLEQGLDINEKDYGATVLQRLGLSAKDYYGNAIGEMEQKLQLLLKKGASVNEIDSLGRTSIDCATSLYTNAATKRFVELLRAAGGKTGQELGIAPPPSRPRPYDPWLYIDIDTSGGL